MSESTPRWTDAGGGLELTLAAEREAYATGEPVFVILRARNVSSAPIVIRANATSAEGDVLRSQFRLCPLYALDAVEVGTRAGDGWSTRSWSPVPSQMFMLDRWCALAPGQALATRARLDSPFWEPTEERPARGLSLSRGEHRVAAVMTAHVPTDETIAAVRAHLASPRADDVEAFFELGPTGLSLHDARQLEAWEWRLWRGAARTEPSAPFRVG